MKSVNGNLHQRMTYQLRSLFKFCKDLLVIECHNFVLTGYQFLESLCQFHSALSGSTAQPSGQNTNINLSREGISSRLLQSFTMKPEQTEY